MAIERRRLLVTGVVQGVGFRPFVWRLATEHGVAGFVANLGDAGVEIQVEGKAEAIEAFARDLVARRPPLARIDAVHAERFAPRGEVSFAIAVSRESGAGGAGSLPPDIATCPACLSDLRGQTRYRGYWATSCTDCGPRFTVVESVPYDRPNTSMRDFPLCPACAAEYTSPADRRYHAETTACPACGPRLTFDGSSERPIERAAEALLAGKVVAMQGIGGTHLAGDATSAKAVSTLRSRLGRPGQPFALMATEDVLSRIANVSDPEWAALRGLDRPIVVLKSRLGALPEGVAPGLHTVGVMLPYTGLHDLLFARLDRPLVMTSANLPGRPMLIEPAEIRLRLAGIADHHLLHDRRIVARCDDSVRRRSGGTLKFLRRSRGHVPEPIRVDLGDDPILALGPETDVTFAIYARGAVTLSQHIGSVDHLETYAYLRQAIDHLSHLVLAGTPRVVACDLHPRFLTTRLAEEVAQASGARLARVQHHEAHLASVMAEHGLDRAVGVVLDGYGYGRDGAAWGGEILLANDGRIRRVGSLTRVRLPGGDLATQHPLRMAASYLLAGGTGPEEVEAFLQGRGMAADEAHAVRLQAEGTVSAPWTTSAGRFLDAVSAWLGVCAERTYEGEPAMRLEAVAASGRPIEVPIRLAEQDERRVLDAVTLFRDLVALRKETSAADVAATAQEALARGMARLALEAAAAAGIHVIALSGGVAYNDAISTAVREEVESAGFRFVTNDRVPCGDGGVALGQAAIASRSACLGHGD